MAGLEAFIQTVEAKEGAGTFAANRIVVEEIARGDFNILFVQIIGSLVGQILSWYARLEVTAEWVPKICSGDEIVGIGLSEPQAGSDAGMPRLQARREGGGYVLNGQKSLSFCDQEGAAVVVARTSADEVRVRGISVFLVPLDAPRATRARFEDMGTVGVRRGVVHFESVRIPENHLLGEDGNGSCR